MAGNASYKYPDTFPKIDGVWHNVGMSKKWLASFKDLPVRACRDVFIDTYPKSGTTWVSEIMWQIYHEGNIHYTSIHHRVPCMTCVPFEQNLDTKQQMDEFFLNHPSPRIFKFHLPYHQVPMGDGSGDKPKCIYVIRNPKDVAVSYYYHYKGVKMFEFENRSWDEFFEMFINDQAMYGSWFDHVLGWWAHRDDPNVLILKYEDVKMNLVKAVEQIAKFLDKELSQDVVKRIVEQTTFSAMASDNSKGRFFDCNAIETQLRVVGSTKFIRKGEVGDWQNYFTEEQNRRFDDLFEKRMAGSGLEVRFK